MKSYLLELVSDIDQISDYSVSIQSNAPGLGLSEMGTTWKDEDSIAKIEVRDDVLFLSCQRNSITLERAGRVRQLEAGKSVQLLAGDLVLLKLRKIRIKSLFVTENRTLLNSLSRVGAKVMHAAAAALFLTACNTQVITVEETGKSVPKSCQCMNEPEEKLVQCCQGLSEEDMKTCCELLIQLEKSVKCPGDDSTDVQNQAAQAPKASEEPDDMIQALCPDKKNDDLKSCCDELDDVTARMACCTYLESNTALKCEEPQIVEPQVMGDFAADPFEGMSAQDIKTHCESLADSNEHQECCKLLEKRGEGVVCDKRVCDGKNGKELKKCCEKLDFNSKDYIECCNRLKEQGEGLKCIIKRPPEKQPVRKRPAGGMQVYPRPSSLL